MVRVPVHLRKPTQRAVRASRTVEVGREWRVGTRSGFGRPGGPGFFGGTVVVMISSSVPDTKILISW